MPVAKVGQNLPPPVFGIEVNDLPKNESLLPKSLVCYWGFVGDSSGFYVLREYCGFDLSCLAFILSFS